MANTSRNGVRPYYRGIPDHQVRRRPDL